MAFGATRAKLMAENLGEHAPLDVQASARPGDLAGEAKYAEALETAQQRLALTERTYGGEHVLMATCLNDVATFVQAYGRFDEAEALFERASRLQRKLLGATRPVSSGCEAGAPQRG